MNDGADMENNGDGKWSPSSSPRVSPSPTPTMFGADLAYSRGQGDTTVRRSRNSTGRQIASNLAVAVVMLGVLTTAGVVAAEDPQQNSSLGRDAKQLVVRPSPGAGAPSRRLHLPGKGNDNLNSRLQHGPLTLHNGRLRPVATIERVDKNVELDFERDSAASNSIPNRNFPVRSFGGPAKKIRPKPPLATGPGRPGGGRVPDRSSFFPQNNVPFSYNSKPVPEVYLNDFSPLEEFDQFNTNRRGGPKVSAADSEASASEVFHDWSTKVSQSKVGQQGVSLDTKYFSITYPDPDTDPLQPPTTTDPGLTYLGGKPGLVLRKVKGRKKTSTSPSVTSTVRIGTRAEMEGEGDAGSEEEECGDCREPGLNTTLVRDNLAGAGAILPSYEQLLKHFKKEVWVIPVLAAAGIIVLVLVIFEIYLLSKTINANPSRRHLFLGQMLLLGLLSCAAMATVFTLQPTPLACAALRLGTGLAYSLVYSTLLVKLVFLISLNSGVYLPATYQSLLLCFAILIQLVIGIQWLVTSPPDVVEKTVEKAEAAEDSSSAEDVEISAPEVVFRCATMFQQQLLGLLYVVFLILVVVVLSFKSRGVRENYREAMYVGLTMGFTVAIWVIWIVAGLIVPTSYQDVAAACGMIACTAITFVIMFMPKGRQLSAMGREGVYAEDRTDVYTGDSGTGSTGSSGTPSPSFFPVKPRVNAGFQEDSAKEFKERLRDRERMETPPVSHRNLQLFGSPSSPRRHLPHPHHVTILDTRARHVSSSPTRHGRHVSGSPVRESRHAAALYGQPALRSSHGDLHHLHRASTRHKELSRFSSHRDLSRSDPVRSSRRRHRDSAREIQSTISPRRAGGCGRCHQGAVSHHHHHHQQQHQRQHNPAFHY